MYWGQLITVRAKKEYKCVWCKDPIQVGREYWGLTRVIANKGRITTKVHKNACFNRWVNTQSKLRQERIRTRRLTTDYNRNPVGRPRLELAEEVALVRSRVLHMIVIKKGELKRAYIKGDLRRINTIKSTLAKYLRESAESPEFEPLPKFKWDQEFLTLVQAGIDPKLSHLELKRADGDRIQTARILEKSCELGA